MLEIIKDIGSGNDISTLLKLRHQNKSIQMHGIRENELNYRKFFILMTFSFVDREVMWILDVFISY